MSERQSFLHPDGWRKDLTLTLRYCLLATAVAVGAFLLGQISAPALLRILAHGWLWAAVGIAPMVVVYHWQPDTAEGWGIAWGYLALLATGLFIAWRWPA